MKYMSGVRWISGLLCMLAPMLAGAQDGRGDVVYVPTPQVVVDEMLTMAKIGPKDYIIDLGSGDGRMVITAAKKFGARGFGVDLDTYLLKIANDNARKEGVADRAQFFERNLFETSLIAATVVSSYLLPEMNVRLRPKLLALNPGTRIVAHDYDMGDWPPDEQKTLSVPEKVVGNPGVSYVYLYYVPAKVAGVWESRINTGSGEQSYQFNLDQLFQVVNGVMQAGSASTKFTSRVRGEQISFITTPQAAAKLPRHEFSGRIKGDTISGMVKIGEGAAQRETPWVAKLVKRAEPRRPADEAGR